MFYTAFKYFFKNHYSCTNLFNQSLMLIWLAKVAANILCRDCVLLAFAHPALVLFLLWETVPEDLESLPYGLLAHWSNQRKTLYTLKKKNTCKLAELASIVVISKLFWLGFNFRSLVKIFLDLYLYLILRWFLMVDSEKMLTIKKTA